MMRYYSRMRPIMPGGYPRQYTKEIVNFDDKQYCPEIADKAWGYIETEERLPDDVMYDYELTAAGTQKKEV